MNITKISPAQIIAAISFVLGQVVAYGILSSQTEQLIVSVATIVLPGILMIADAVIHHAYAKVNVATIAAEAKKAVEMFHPADTSAANTIASGVVITPTQIPPTATGNNP